MQDRLFKRIRRDQTGITGLETAIILIAFVVVASVFAYTVLSAGIFSSERGKEAIHSGLEGARSSMQIIGAVKAIAETSLSISNADAAWTASTDVTGSTDTVDRKEGTGSAEFLFGATFTTGLAAYFDTGTKDLSTHYTIRFWIKSDATAASGDYTLGLDDTANCGSITEAFTIPALVADTWQRVQVKSADPSLLGSIECVALTAVVDPVTATINLDFIEAPGEVDQLVITLANALEGEAIDLTITTDSDSDGLLSDEASATHAMIVDFINENERVADIAWTIEKRGKADADSLLEVGEKFDVIIDLKALALLPVARDQFSIILRPGTGAAITIEKTIPGTIDAVMDLN